MFIETSAKAGFNIKVSSRHHVAVSVRSATEEQSSILLHVQALFRKIAAALPGMESLSATKQEDLVDINLAPVSGQNKGGPNQSAASGCAC